MDADVQSWQGRRILMATSAAVFLLFFQTYMIAPLIPFLAKSFGVEQQKIALLVPAYMLPYAAAALVCGVLSDHLGRRAVLITSMVSFPVCSLFLAMAPSFGWLIGLRMISGAVNVGIAVMSLSLVGDLFPPNERGEAIGWIFGAIAGGAAFGSSLGAILSPLLGWRGLFGMTGILGLLLLAFVSRLWEALDVPRSAQIEGEGVFRGYIHVLRTGRAQRTYWYIFLNAVFHSGVFTWIGVYLHDRYGLGEFGIGVALLGYGLPGFFCGPMIGAMVDRHGRRYLIPIGLATAALSAGILVLPVSIWIAAFALTLLSLGFDMSHPLLAGIVTGLDPRRRGRAMGLNTFAIFAGYGCGSIIFGWICRGGMQTALTVYALLQGLLAVGALAFFRGEVAERHKAVPFEKSLTAIQSVGRATVEG